MEQPESVKPGLRSPRYNSSQSSESHGALLTSPGLVTMTMGYPPLLASSAGSMPILGVKFPRPNLSRARASRCQNEGHLACLDRRDRVRLSGTTGSLQQTAEGPHVAPAGRWKSHVYRSASPRNFLQTSWLSSSVLCNKQYFQALCVANPSDHPGGLGDSWSTTFQGCLGSRSS